MKIALIGYGKMGKTIEQIAVSAGHTIVLKVSIDNLEDNTIARIREADVAIEFTVPKAPLTISSAVWTPACRSYAVQRGGCQSWTRSGNICIKKNGHLFVCQQFQHWRQYIL